MSEKVIYEFETELAILKVYDDYCELEHKKNAISLLVTNKYFAGKKKFYYSDLTAVQFREPGKITDGYLEFEYPGSRSGNSAGAYSSENSIAFIGIHLERMKDIYTFIDEKIQECKRGRAYGSKSTSSADDLLKYAELMEKGLITREEFEQKKAETLKGEAQVSEAQIILEKRRVEEARVAAERERQEAERRAQEERLRQEKQLAEEQRRREQQEISTRKKAIDSKIANATKAMNKPLLLAFYIGLGAIYLLSIIIGIATASNAVGSVAAVIFLGTIFHAPSTVTAFLALKTSASKAGALKTCKTLSLVFSIIGIVLYGIIVITTGIGDTFAPVLCALLVNVLDLILPRLIKAPVIDQDN